MYIYIYTPPMYSNPALPCTQRRDSFLLSPRYFGSLGVGEPASDWPHWPKEKKPQGLQAAKPARPRCQVGQGEPWSSCCGWERPGEPGPRSLATAPGSCALQTGSRQWVPHGEEPLKCSNGNFWKNELLSWHSCFSLFTLQALHWNMKQTHTSVLKLHVNMSSRTKSLPMLPRMDKGGLLSKWNAYLKLR